MNFHSNFWGKKEIRVDKVPSYMFLQRVSRYKLIEKTVSHQTIDMLLPEHTLFTPIGSLEVGT